MLPFAFLLLPSYGRSSEVADEHHVGADGAAREGELLTITRPLEAEDLIGFIIRQLPGRASINGLAHDVRNAVSRIPVK